MNERYSRAILHHLFKMVVTIRRCEESFIEPILKGEIKCPVHLYTGQEAIAAGICEALTERDYVFGTHRSHGHYLAKGGDITAMVAEVFCRDSGCARGRGGSMHLTSPRVGMMGAAPIVAGTISLAVGAALASRIRAEDRVAVAFFGDGAVGEGVLYESLNFAAIRHLPVIFVCENNLYSTHMPIQECRPSESIYEIAQPFGIETKCLDGNDVLTVYAAGLAAVDRCRQGQGPVFLEFRTYRFHGHVGPDDNIQGTHTDIRPIEEIESWRRHDPIEIFGHYLLTEAGFSSEELAMVKQEVEIAVEAAFGNARQSAFPSPEQVNDYVFR